MASLASNPIQGVKGSDCFDSTGDPRVDLSVQLVRGASVDVIAQGLDKILALGTPEAREDAYLLAFQTRNIRGGKGERKISEEMFKHLLLNADLRIVAEITRLLPLIPHYGCWRDLFSLAALVPNVQQEILMLSIEQLKKDAATPEDQPISLCAKWAPREDRMKDLAVKMAALLFPNIKDYGRKMKSYRKMVSALNKRIQTTEIKMCAGDWELVEPGKVPGRCLQKHRLAFLNEVAAKRKGQKVPKGEIRHPDDEVRMKCRENFQAFFQKAAKGEVVVKGADTVFPHEVISRIYDAGRDGLSADEQNFAIGQWAAFVKAAKEGGGLSKCIALCDFSGSMNGLPKLISTALGLLVAEVSGLNKILTFDSVPEWHEFRAEDTILQRVASLTRNLGQGLSTDFQKAMDLILGDVKARRCRPEDLPKDLLVFTDMGWDDACGSSHQGTYTKNHYRHVVKTEYWQTHIQMIREAWMRAGEDMWGPGTVFQPPRIVVWNLAVSCSDNFHARANEDGVVLLSGWSPALFKVLQAKNVEVETPYQALRAQLDDPMYDQVRTANRQGF